MREYALDTRAGESLPPQIMEGEIGWAIEGARTVKYIARDIDFEIALDRLVHVEDSKDSNAPFVDFYLSIKNYPTSIDITTLPSEGRLHAMASIGNHKIYDSGEHMLFKKDNTRKISKRIINLYRSCGYPIPKTHNYSESIRESIVDIVGESEQETTSSLEQ